MSAMQRGSAGPVTKAALDDHYIDFHIELSGFTAQEPVEPLNWWT